MSDTTVSKLDRIDRAILNELIRNARISMIELGQKVGLSKTPVALRVKRLEAEGVITGYDTRSTDRYHKQDAENERKDNRLSSFRLS